MRHWHRRARTQQAMLRRGEAARTQRARRTQARCMLAWRGALEKPHLKLHKTQRAARHQRMRVQLKALVSVLIPIRREGGE